MCLFRINSNDSIPLIGVQIKARVSLFFFVVDVLLQILDCIASVEVTQTFVNKENTPIEAV